MQIAIGMLARICNSDGVAALLMNALHVCLLGDFKLEQNGELIPTVNHTLLQSLLAYLLLHSHTPQLYRSVALKIWPDSSYSKPTTICARCCISCTVRWLQIHAQSLQRRPEIIYTVDIRI